MRLSEGLGIPLGEAIPPLATFANTNADKPRIGSTKEAISGRRQSVAVQTLRNDIVALSLSSKERLGYATQKQEPLLERILNARPKKGFSRGLLRGQCHDGGSSLRGVLRPPRAFALRASNRTLRSKMRVPMFGTMHAYEVRPRKDHRGVDLISDVLPFGRQRSGRSRAFRLLPVVAAALMLMAAFAPSARAALNSLFQLRRFYCRWAAGFYVGVGPRPRGRHDDHDQYQ